MASPPRSPAIPEEVQRIWEQHNVTIPLFNALVGLQKQREATGDENHVHHDRLRLHNNSDNPSWGRQSPQLTPTPSPSPSPSHNCDAIKTSHLQLLGTSGANILLHAPRHLPTPPKSSRQSEAHASISPRETAVARRPRRQRSLRTPAQPPHTMLMRPRARASRAQERQLWELDASGRRARRVTDH